MKYLANVAVVVNRVSDEEQEEAGNSLPAQDQRSSTYCTRNEMKVIKSYSFQESAYKQKRDMFDEIMKFVKNEAKTRPIAVCFDKVDRFSRGAIFDKRVGELFELALAGKVELHFVSDNQVIHGGMSAVENFHFMISLGLAKYYSDAISDNVKRAFEKMRSDGVWIGKPRIGYMNVTDESTGKKDIIIDPERGHLVARMFDMFATEQYSVETIWREITAMGLRSRDGKELSRSNVHYVLRDSFYYGMAVSKKHGPYKHKYKPLITKGVFDQCEAVLDKRNNTRTKELSKPFLFKGLLKCQHCGCAMSPEIKKGKYVYYSCANGKKICKRTYVREEVLLKPIYEVFQAFESIPEPVQETLVEELRSIHEGEKVFHQKQISRIRVDYDKVQRRIDALLDMHLDGSITSTEYDKKLQELKSKQSILNIEMEEYGEGDYRFHINVKRVLDLSRRMKAIFDSSEVMEQRAMLSYLLQNPTVKGKKISYDLKKPYNLVLELALETERATQGDSSGTFCPTGLRR